ncbi:MFS transporter, SET family, sugar efflux transporter [Friedmanniella luteola]|uniref:MFS transporter, SET family, sugar efflux transporter n=1 Tax=Friedmanniella luteola TaxID=546871 RepID=A0A1H1ZEG7_9ACTN|nr:MFS transporter, SET family, sugar efflux transporter [Friedmanniella luteola]
MRIILASRFYRSAFAALLLSGLAVSATLPQLTLFLVRDLGASYTVAGLYYVTNLAAPVAGFLLGRLSDRREDRLGLFRVCAVVGALGWLAMALSTEVWMPFVISAVALSISGASMAQLFAATRDELSRQPTGADNRILSAVRMAFTAGWVLGPVLGSWLGSVVGLRPLLVATAVLTLSQVLPLGGQRVLRFRHPGHELAGTRSPRGSRRRMVPLLAFTGLCVLAMTGDTIKFGFLPLYMADELGVPDTVRGAVIAIQPLLELTLMPFLARFADRYGPLKVMVFGLALGVGANLAFATSTGVAGLFLGQLLAAGLWAALGALGVSIAQHLYPEGVGTASGVFLSSMTLGAATGGLIGGFGVARLGLPEVFYVPAVLSAIALVGLVVLERRLRVREPLAVPEPVASGRR